MWTPNVPHTPLRAKFHFSKIKLAFAIFQACPCAHGVAIVEGVRVAHEPMAMTMGSPSNHNQASSPQLV